MPQTTADTTTNNARASSASIISFVLVQLSRILPTSMWCRWSNLWQRVSQNMRVSTTDTGHTSLFSDLPKMSTTHVARFSVIDIVSPGVSEWVIDVQRQFNNFSYISWGMISPSATWPCATTENMISPSATWPCATTEKHKFLM